MINIILYFNYYPIYLFELFHSASVSSLLILLALFDLLFLLLVSSLLSLFFLLGLLNLLDLLRLVLLQATHSTRSTFLSVLLDLLKIYSKSTHSTHPQRIPQNTQISHNPLIDHLTFPYSHLQFPHSLQLNSLSIHSDLNSTWTSFKLLDPPNQSDSRTSFSSHSNHRNHSIQLQAPMLHTIFLSANKYRIKLQNATLGWDRCEPPFEVAHVPRRISTSRETATDTPVG